MTLDQFSRNLYRNDKRAFAQDAKAVHLTKYAIAHRHYDDLQEAEIMFCLMPLIHSESLDDHELAYKLHAQTLKDDPMADLTIKSWTDHSHAIRQFGRYPHRNAVLGRKSTAEEVAFLEQPNSAW